MYNLLIKSKDDLKMLALTEKKNNSIAINENLLNDFYSFLDVSDKTLITYKIMTTLLRLRSL